jgi:hypothetical protein
MKSTKVQIRPAVSAEGGQGTIREPAPETESAPPPGLPGPEAGDERDEGAHEEAGYGYGV